MKNHATLSLKKVSLLTAAFTVLTALFLNAVPVQAAKTTLTGKTLELGVADFSDISNCLVNPNPKASYTYASSNKNIVTVSKKGIVKTRKTGTATITVRQALKKKTTKVGTITVKVKNARLSKYNFTEMRQITNQPGYYRSTYNTPDAEWLMPVIDYQNPKAVYTVYSGNKSKISVDKKGFIKDTYGTGTVELTVKETYNKKTRTIGTFPVALGTPSFTAKSTERTIAAGESFRAYEYLDHCANYAVLASHSLETPDINEAKTDVNLKSEANNEVKADVNTGSGTGNVLSAVTENGKWTEMFKGTSEGTRYLHYYMYDYKQQKYTTLLGTIKINVKEMLDASSIQMAFEIEPDTYGYDPADGLTLSCLTSDSCRQYEVFAEPYNYTGTLEASSTDESVVKVTAQKSPFYFPEYRKTGMLYLTALKPGTAIVTVKANGAQKSFPVTVTSQNFQTDSSYRAEIFFAYDGDVREDDITFTSSDESVATAKLFDTETMEDGSSDSTFNLKYLEFTVNTGKSLPNGAKSAPVTITAYCKGTKIYAVTLDVSKP